jgi:Tat protein translocase TatB subunit
MFDIGIGEMAAIGVLALLVFGPDRLPTAAATAGRFVRQAREHLGRVRDEVASAAGDDVTDAMRELSSLTSSAPRSVQDASRDAVRRFSDGL